MKKFIALGAALLAIGCGNSDQFSYNNFNPGNPLPLAPSIGVADSFQVLGNGQLTGSVTANDQVNGGTVNVFQNPSNSGGSVAITAAGAHAEIALDEEDAALEFEAGETHQARHGLAYGEGGLGQGLQAGPAGRIILGDLDDGGLLGAGTGLDLALQHLHPGAHRAAPGVLELPTMVESPSSTRESEPDALASISAGRRSWAVCTSCTSTPGLTAPKSSPPAEVNLPEA